jgi:asparagine synthase (glutamine-hydrolysing)
MCGITGIYSKNMPFSLEKRVSKMNSSIKHRGPNAEGIYKDKNLVLGHRRLSIIDTRDVANQPMHSNDNKWHIVFNGEIYNFKEIESKLKYDFRTTSDTEVILASVQEKGLIGLSNKLMVCLL